MTHRNFGIVTTRAASGAQPPRGPHYRADTTRPDSSNVFSLADHVSSLRDPFNSQVQEPEPFIHPFELGSSLLFAFVVALPLVMVAGAVVGYALFISEPI